MFMFLYKSLPLLLLHSLHSSVDCFFMPNFFSWIYISSNICQNEQQATMNNGSSPASALPKSAHKCQGTQWVRNPLERLETYIFLWAQLENPLRIRRLSNIMKKDQIIPKKKLEDGSINPKLEEWQEKNWVILDVYWSTDVFISYGSWNNIWLLVIFRNKSFPQKTDSFIELSRLA